MKKTKQYNLISNCMSVQEHENNKELTFMIFCITTFIQSYTTVEPLSDVSLH